MTDGETPFQKLSRFCAGNSISFWVTLSEINEAYLREHIPGGAEILKWRLRHGGNPNQKMKIVKKTFLKWPWRHHGLTMEQATDRAIQNFFDVVEGEE